MYISRMIVSNDHFECFPDSTHMFGIHLNKPINKQTEVKALKLLPTHKELKQQVVVWILVLKADRALFLQMDGVDERDRALISVGLQIVSLRHPGRTAGPKMFD